MFGLGLKATIFRLDLEEYGLGRTIR